MTWEHCGAVAIVGVGYSEIERHNDTPLGLLAMGAARAAVDDCGLALSDIDGLATYPSAPFTGAKNQDGQDIVTPELFLGSPELGKIRWYSEAARGMIASSFRDAAHALIAGACDYALVWRAMLNPRGAYGRLIADEVGGSAQFSAPYGCNSPIQWHALAYRHYLQTYGGHREDLAALAVTPQREPQSSRGICRSRDGSGGLRRRPDGLRSALLV